MKSAEELKQKGAKSVSAFSTHGIFSGTFYEKLEASSIDNIFVTDSFPIRNTG